MAGTVGAMVLLIVTDFVSGNEEFKKLAMRSRAGAATNQNS